MARKRLMDRVRTASVDWHEYADGETLARALANDVAQRLAAAVETRATALLAVSGGTTPKRFFEHLSRSEIDWQKVTVTLVDERFVPPSSDRSNEQLVREHLLRSNASAARFVGLYREAANVEEAARYADETIQQLPLPLDVAILGMGGDGHTASFFPDAEGIATLLASHAAPSVTAIRAQSAQEPRLTLTMPTLTGARFQALHMEGAEKRAVLDGALSGDADSKPPIRAVIERARHPFPVYWAPTKEQST